MFLLIIENESDREKAERLYYKYRKLMYLQAFDILHDSALAEDAVSESFIRVINKLDNIDEDAPARSKNYLVIICRNVAIDIYNGRKEISAEDIDDYSDTFVSAELPEDIIITRESVSEMMNAIKQLEPKYRDVFILKRIYGYSREDIARVFGLNVETVKKRLVRAKAMLLKSLELEASR